MKSIETIVNWRLLGMELMAADDSQQAEFFSGVAQELATWGSHGAIGAQLLFVNDRLSTAEKKQLEKYLPTLWDEESP